MSSILALATVALAAMGANAGTYSSSKYGGSIKCKATGKATAVSYSKDAYAAAVASLVKSACDPGWTGDLTEMADKMHDFGYAVATASAAATAQCKAKSTKGAKVVGCAYSDASAYAAAFAYAEVHALAVAGAFSDYCTCQDVSAFDFGEADLKVLLSTEAYADASAWTCATGNENNKQDAYALCYASSIAHVWAEAAARASIAGGCCGTTAEAVAEIEASVDAYVENHSKCIFNGNGYYTGYSSATDEAVH